MCPTASFRNPGSFSLMAMPFSKALASSPLSRCGKRAYERFPRRFFRVRPGSGMCSAHVPLARTITCPPVCKGDRGVGPAVCLGSRSPLGHRAFSVTLANLQIGKPNHPRNGKIIFLLNQSILS